MSQTGRGLTIKRLTFPLLFLSSSFFFNALKPRFRAGQGPHLSLLLDFTHAFSVNNSPHFPPSQMGLQRPYVGSQVMSQSILNGPASPRTQNYPRSTLGSSDVFRPGLSCVYFFVSLFLRLCFGIRGYVGIWGLQRLWSLTEFLSWDLESPGSASVSGLNLPPSSASLDFGLGRCFFLIFGTTIPLALLRYPWVSGLGSPRPLFFSFFFFS